MNEEKIAYWFLVIGLLITFLGFLFIQLYYCDFCVATGISPPVWINILCVSFSIPPIIGLSMVIGSVYVLYRSEKE